MILFVAILVVVVVFAAAMYSVMNSYGTQRPEDALAASMDTDDLARPEILNRPVRSRLSD